jgi:hypothetical protein
MAQDSRPSSFQEDDWYSDPYASSFEEADDGNEDVIDGYADEDVDGGDLDRGPRMSRKII